RGRQGRSERGAGRSASREAPASSAGAPGSCATAIRARHCPEARRLADARGPAESSAGPRAGWKRSERDDAARPLAPLECGVRLVDLLERVGAREQLVELQLPCSVE